MTAALRRRRCRRWVGADEAGDALGSVASSEVADPFGGLLVVQDGLVGADGRAAVSSSSLTSSAMTWATVSARRIWTAR